MRSYFRWLQVPCLYLWKKILVIKAHFEYWMQPEQQTFMVTKLCNFTKKFLLLLGTSIIGGNQLILISQCCKIWKPGLAHRYLSRSKTNNFLRKSKLVLKIFPLQLFLLQCFDPKQNLQLWSLPDNSATLYSFQKLW